MTRRDSFTSTGLLLADGAQRLAAQTEGTVRMGLIGTGNRGQYVGGIYGKDPRVRINAICDLYPDRIDEAKTKIPAARDAKVFKDYRDVLSAADIDAVYIATPVYLHPEHFEAAVKAGKHVYCEKPTGADVAGVKRFLAAARMADPSRVIFVGFQRRFSPDYAAAEAMLREGKVGELLLMMSYWFAGSSAFREAPPSPYPGEQQKIRHWLRDTATSGDFMVEQNCHGVDVLNWFASARPLTAIGDGGRRARKSGDNTDHINVSFHYPNGLKGWLLGTQLPASPFREVKEQFFGTLGTLETHQNYSAFMAAGQREWKRADVKREMTNDAVQAFLDRIVNRSPLNMAASACDSTFTAILARMAGQRRREVTWEELLASA